MAKINQIVCLGTDQNTGIARCTANLGLLKVAIAVPKGTYVTNTNMSDPITYIDSKIHHDTPASRWYPLPKFVNFEANNTAAGTQSFNYGNSKRVGTDVSVWTFQTIQGDLCGYKALEKFNGKNEEYDFYFMDHMGQLWGRVKTTTSGEVRLYAFTMDDVYVPTLVPGTNAATPEFKISFMFEDDTQLRGQLGLHQTGYDFNDLQGVNSVDITLIGSVGSNGTVIVEATTTCGGANLGDLFGSTLADAAAWILTAKDDGAEITLTSVSYNATTKRYTIDPDQTDTDYDIGDTLVLKLEPIADLVALGIAYYESPTGLEYVAN